MTCPSCSTQNQEGEEFCTNCGTDLAPKQDQTQGGADPPPVQQETSAAPADPAVEEEVKFWTLPKKQITVESVGLTHPGLVKDNNEDALFVDKVEYPVHKIVVHVVVLTDGMGGEPAGEVFGSIACHETWLGIRWLLPYFEQQHGFAKWEFWQFVNSQLTKHLPAQIASANSRVRRYGKAKQLKAGECGATIVVAVLVCDLDSGHVRLHGYNEGDARCALVLPDQFRQLSTDHTIGGAPYRFLGKHDHVSGTSFGYDVWMSEQDFTSFWVLLYSDGLWNMLSPDQMTAAALQSQHPKALTETLVATSLAVSVPHGKLLGDEKVTTGDDNITIAAIRIAAEEGDIR